MKRSLFILLSALILFSGCDLFNAVDKNDGGKFSPSNVIELDYNTWGDGNIPTSKDEQWFKIINPNYDLYNKPTVHINFGTLTNLNVQMYNPNGTTREGKKNFSGNTKINKWEDSLAPFQPYYLKVTAGSGGGTYMIAFNLSDTAPVLPITLPSNATALAAADVWNDCDIPTEKGEQWFKFTATSTQNPRTYSQYIHINFNTLNNLDIQIYDNRGYLVNSKNLSGDKETVGYTESHLTEGQEYYIKASASSGGGTYKIMFNLSHEEPVTYIILPSDVTSLAADVWTDCDIPTETDEQWFKFPATAETQYIHFKAGTLRGVYIQLYNADGSKSGIKNDPRECVTFYNLTVGREYYARISPYNNSSYDYLSYGTYQILLSKSPVAPIALPDNAVTLTKGIWTDENFTETGGAIPWFKFTATDETQYVHVNFSTLNEMYIQMYDEFGYTVGNPTYIYKNGANRYASNLLTAGHEYYINVIKINNGTYQITFNASESVPAIKFPSDVTTLTDRFVEVYTSTGEKWFKFTAEAETQYIHIDFSSATAIYVQMYDDEGNSSGSPVRFSASAVRDSGWNITIGREYYFKAWPESNTNSNDSYRIATNDSFVTPEYLSISPDVWNDEYLFPYKEHWLKLTATANTKYIHVNLGSMKDLYVQAYDENGNTVGNRRNFKSNSTAPEPITVSEGKIYYIRVTPAAVSDSGSYKITVNGSTTAPSVPIVYKPLYSSWTNSGFTDSKSDEWFVFTATSGIHYIHASFDTLSSLYGLVIHVFDEDNNVIIEYFNFTAISRWAISNKFVAGKKYYVHAQGGKHTGTYSLAVTTSATTPK